MNASIRCRNHRGRLAALVGLTVLVGSMGATARASTLYVAKTGNDANDGLTWATARRTVQASLDAAAAGDQVWVAAGTYVENITLKDGAALYGGFSGTETDLAQRDWRANVTVLDGNAAGSVVTVPRSATAGTRIDGFVIRNGKGTREGLNTFGGGIYCLVLSSPTIANNTITGNTSDAAPAGELPGAAEGGGICAHAGAPTIIGNRIIGNVVIGSSARGGGIYCNSSGARIANNVIAGNSAVGGDMAYGGGIYSGYNVNSSYTIVNNTITGNSATAQSYVEGGGMYCDSTVTVANNIVAFNTSGIYTPTPLAAVTLRNNNVYGNDLYNYSNVSIGIGDISADPRLAAPVYAEMHLQAGSPCIDAGEDSLVVAGSLDLDGQPRIQGAHVDIGADEFVGTTPAFSPAVVRVSTAGDDANDGSDWAHAKRTVQAGINAATMHGGEVWVAGGTYNQRISLKALAHVYGGFAGGETTRSQRDPAANLTVLDGGQGGSVVSATGVGYRVSTIDGFTIRNGKASQGGGIYCYHAAPVVSNNVITGNKATSGGGIYAVYSAMVISGNRIVSNIADDSVNHWGASGGGITCGASRILITGNTIAGNSTIIDSVYDAIGGGISCGGPGTIVNNFIVNNVVKGGSAYGGGLAVSYSTCTVANNVIVGNTSDNCGGGISCDGGTPAITNNTIVGNACSTGAVFTTTSTSAVFSNNIVAFNERGVSCSSTTVRRNNNVYGNEGGNYPGGSFGPGEISQDPRLVAAGYGQVHLQAGSPCINAGYDAAVQGGWTDMDGQTRIQGGRVDIGADEFNGTAPAYSPPVVRVSPEGNDASDGSSWPAAKRTVQAAIDAAAVSGGDVWVRAGTYNERIDLKHFVHVFGGFAGGETSRQQRNWGTNRTVLSGGPTGNVVTGWYCGYRLSTIDGFMICNGSGVTGGAIYCFAGSPTISHNAIRGCRGGISTGDSSPLIANNTIAGNSGTAGGGVQCNHGWPTIINNTITNTSGTAGIDLSYCSAVVSNNIVAFNDAGILNNGATVTLNSNDVYGNAAFNYSGSSPGAGDISQDPRLVAAGYGQVHLQAGSPCINAGYDAAVQAGWTDMDGQARIQGGRVDIGADEFSGTPPAYTPLVVRVSPDGNDTSDGSSWPAAKRTVQAAIDAAAVSGGDVWVRAGTYNERITLKVLAYLYGGFAGSEMTRDERDWTAHATILDGGQAGSVVTFGPCGRGLSSIDGLTIRNGKSAKGGGILCSYAGSPVITHNTITGNSSLTGSGAGIHCEYSYPTITNNIISGNSAATGGGINLGYGSVVVSGNRITGNSASNGGGIYCGLGCTPTIVNNTITGNTTASGGHGAGIYCGSATARIISNTIAGNKASGSGYGGGIYCTSSSTPAIANNAIVANSATYGGGIYGDTFSPSIVNNTVTANIATYGGAIYLRQASGLSANNILAANSTGFLISGGTPVLRNNNAYGNGSYNYSWMPNTTGTAGNVSVNPLFVRSASDGGDGWGDNPATPGVNEGANDDYGDLRLQRTSPCVDAGSNGDVPADIVDLDADGNSTEPLPLDLAGGARFADSPVTADTGTGTAPIVDTGAYEYLCGDIDGDSHVDVLDLLYLVDAFGSTLGEAAYDARCDLNGDAAVDVADLLVFIENFGKS